MEKAPVVQRERPLHRGSATEHRAEPPRTAEGLHRRRGRAFRVSGGGGRTGPAVGPSWTCAGKPYAAGARRHGWPTRPARGCAWRDKSRPGRTARVPAEARTGTVEPTVSAGGRRADAFRGKAGKETLRRSRVGHKDEEFRVSESDDRRKPSERCVLCDRNASKIEESADGGRREVKAFQVAGIGLKIGFRGFRGEVAEQRSPQGGNRGFIAVREVVFADLSQFGFCKPLALR